MERWIDRNFHYMLPMERVQVIAISVSPRVKSYIISLRLCDRNRLSLSLSLSLIVILRHQRPCTALSEDTAHKVGGTLSDAIAAHIRQLQRVALLSQRCLHLLHLRA